MNGSKQTSTNCHNPYWTVLKYNKITYICEINLISS